VVAVYTRTANQKPGNEALHQKLVKAEEAGIMRKKIINQSDELVQTWTLEMKTYHAYGTGRVF
jgi:hypothetical protein